MFVKKIDKKTAFKVVSQKHYSKRLGIFWEGFGLFDDANTLIGVCCFGQPSPAIQKHAFRDRDFRLYELTRLVVDDGIQNAASFLISKALKMLSQQPCAVVSYADSMHGHCGIVYQASNWYYTGETISHDKLYSINGKLFHAITIRDHYNATNPTKWARENKDILNIKIIHPKPKHRYFFFCGKKREKQKMLDKLNYSFKSYPKQEKSTYDTGNLSCQKCI